jgi:hypothetical protein
MQYILKGVLDVAVRQKRSAVPGPGFQPGKYETLDQPRSRLRCTSA